MSLKPIELPPGVVRGATPAMPRGRYWDANLVRWRGQALQPIGGWAKLSSGTVASPARLILPWRDLAGTGRVFVMCDAKIYVMSGVTFTSREPTSPAFEGVTYGTTGGGYGIGDYGEETYGTARSVGPVIQPQAYTWSADTWGEDILCVASSDGRLLHYDTSAGTVMAAVTNAPTGNQAMAVTQERHVLLAGAGGEGRRLAWCSREDYTDWNYASTTNTAGYLDIDTSGLLQSLHPVREGHLLFSEDEVWLVRYVGQPYIYGATRIADGAKPISAAAVVSYGGRAVWMGQEGFWKYEGGFVQPLRCDVSDYIFSNLNRDLANVRVCGSGNRIFSEIWWDYPTGVSAENNRYVIWNFAEDWWSIGARSRTAASDSVVYSKPLAFGTDGYLYKHEEGWLADDVSRLGDVWVETGAVTMEGGARILHATQGQLDTGKTPGAVRMRAYARNTRDGSDVAFGPYTPRVDGYMDCRFGGRDVRLRFEGVEDIDWSLGSMLFDFVPGGER